MKSAIVKLIWISILFVSVFFVACSIDKTTFAQYEINGTVTDAATNLPLKKIRMIRLGTDYLLYSDTIYTDSIGKYSFTLTDYYAKNATFSLKIEDYDAGLNGGEFATQNVNVKFSALDWSYVDIVGDYKGEATKNQDFQLTKK